MRPKKNNLPSIPTQLATGSDWFAWPNENGGLKQKIDWLSTSSCLSVWTEQKARIASTQSILFVAFWLFRVCARNRNGKNEIIADVSCNVSGSRFRLILWCSAWYWFVRHENILVLPWDKCKDQLNDLLLPLFNVKKKAHRHSNCVTLKESSRFSVKRQQTKRKAYERSSARMKVPRLRHNFE